MENKKSSLYDVYTGTINQGSTGNHSKSTTNDIEIEIANDGNLSPPKKNNDPVSTITRESNVENNEVTRSYSRYASTLLCDSQDFEPGQFGSYASYAFIVIGMIGSVLILNYGHDITLSQWTSNCEIGFESACRASGGVFRISFAMCLIFAIQIIGTLIYTKYFDYLWFWKFLLFIGILVGFAYTKGEVFDLNGFAWFARVAGFLYLISQQIILIDFAYTWNDKWVKLSEENETEEGHMNGWLVGLLVVSSILFIASYILIGLMFWQFSCNDSIAIISITLVLSVVATILQVILIIHVVYRSE